MPRGKTPTLEEVQNEYAKHGCLLLETSYQGAMKKMRFKCACGNTYSKTYVTFHVSPHCRTCGRKQAAKARAYDQETIQKFFADNECELLDTYKNTRVPVKYRCKCGNVAKIAFLSFQSGSRCKSCMTKKISGPGHWKWVANRELVRQRKVVAKKCYAAIYNVLEKINQHKSDHAHILLGYTPTELHAHLSQHPDWNKVQDQKWNLDHVFPIKAFLEYGISDIRTINSLDNLQPLLEKLNFAKNDKYDPKQFEAWLSTKNIPFIRPTF